MTVAGGAKAQSIVPATDGTGTVVNVDGNTYDITGGFRSSDGQNLFHSLESFGLTQQEIANFIADPGLRNILSRVVGGNTSIIDGTIQMSGGNANLFIMNPAGIIFGSTAQVNVPADFTATSASSVNFGSELLEVMGNPEYASLLGDPTALNFDASTVNTVMNAGTLTVGDGHTVTLAGEQVINLGTIEAPGGTVTLVAVPDRGQIRISQSGSAISLGVNAEDWQSDSDISSFAPLVTGGDLPLASKVNIDENGQVTLAGANSAGTVIASGLIDTASADGSGGTVQITGPQTAVIDATIDASGQMDGGAVMVGGEYRGQGTLPPATNTLVDSDSRITANATGSGDGGQVIIWADDTAAFGGDIDARGGAINGDGGFVEVSGAERLVYDGQVDTSAPNGDFGTLLLDPTDIVITAGGASAGFDGQVLSGDAGPTTISQNQLQALPGNTNVVIQATNSITIEPLEQQGLVGSFSTDSVASLDFQPGSGSIMFEAGGPFVMEPNNSIVTFGRDISISGSELTLGTIDASGSALYSARIVVRSGDGGSINLTSTSGDISAGIISAGGGIGSGAGNNIVINSAGDFTARSTDAQGFAQSPAGDIDITANNFNIEFMEVLAGNLRISNGLDGTITINGQVLPGTTFNNVSGSGTNINFMGDITSNPGAFNLGNSSFPNSIAPSIYDTQSNFWAAQEHWNNVMRDIRRWDSFDDRILSDPEYGLY